MLYTGIKHLHITLVALSGLLFIYRGLVLFGGRGKALPKWSRIAPHIVDTLLLLAGITLAVMSHQYPGAQNWLTAKLVGLVIYIGLGTVALKRRKPVAWVAALLVYAWIIAVAVTKSPLLGLI